MGFIISKLFYWSEIKKNVYQLKKWIIKQFLETYRAYYDNK